MLWIGKQKCRLLSRWDVGAETLDKDRVRPPSKERGVPKSDLGFFGADLWI